MAFTTLSLVKGNLLDYADAESITVIDLGGVLQVCLDGVLTTQFTQADIGTKVNETEWETLVAAAVPPAPVVTRIIVDVVEAESCELDLASARMDHDALPGEEVISVLTLCGEVNVDIERADIGAIVTQAEWDHLFAIAERV